ncbi:MAG: type III pantothenate kinase [Candidatus Krumholzibacteria bacterium]|nr:type III pantothenate kinase [Candidatus Krumholzibacteria bacterium]
MRSLLALDRGNDSLKAALFVGGAIAERFRIRGAGAEETAALVRRLRPDRIAASCVVPAWRAALETALGERFPALFWAGHDSPLPFRLDVEDPRSVGSDRLAAAAGAAARGSSSAVVVDAGTAVTVDILSSGIFTGGAIMPGLGLMLDALHRGTAALPALDPGEAAGEESRGLPGRSTRTAIAAGTVGGYIGGVTALVGRSLEMTTPGAVVYLTGGGAPLLAGRLSPDPVLAPDLVLEGLCSIFAR